MIRARFSLRLPDDLWVSAVSTAHPAATLRLLTGVPLEQRSLELGAVIADRPGDVIDSIEAHPDVHALERIHTGARRALTKYETSERRLYKFLGGPSLPPEFPLVVEDGVMDFGVTTSQDGFDRIGETLDASGLEYELRSVVHTSDTDTLLTGRQREALETADRMGYFDVPRECTLAEVASALGVDRSSASETIRRGVERVVGRHLHDGGTSR